MEPIAKQLRPYQVRLVTDVCRATEDILVEQPTGSGKTVQIVTLIAMHLGQRFSHAVIAAPQEQIEQGFVKRDYDTIAFPESQGVAVPSIQASNDERTGLIRGARGSGLGSIRQIATYLRQSLSPDYALACTHAALNQLTPEQLPENLTGRALFIDEAHHASADGLSQVVALWRERGGQLFFFTATPYRGDGRRVKLDDMRSFRRSLAEHMAEGFAPRHLDSEIVALGHPGDGTTAGEFVGEDTPRNIEEVIAAISRRWLADGRPKTIVRVPPMRDGKSGELVRRLMLAFESLDARVLDATGAGAVDKQRFLSALEAEKSRTYATSGFDVMVGIQRVLEGTDWPVCSAVYCVGMPGSLNTVVQFLGRAMRLKGDDYPAAQRDRAKLVFFVPCGGGAALSELSIDHSRHALLTCCFLADHEVGQEWIVLREVRRGIEAALGNRMENPAAADAENEADVPLDPKIRAEVELVMAAASEQIMGNGGEVTPGELVRMTLKTRPDLPEAALNQIANEILAAQPDAIGEAARERLPQVLANLLRIDPRVREAMAEAFAVVLEEFRDVTLNDSTVLESVGRQVHNITGGQMREFAQRLRNAAPRPLTEGQILEWADSYYARTGEWPWRESGPVTELPDETWGNIEQALVLGLRGLPSGSSLAKLLAEHRGKRNSKGLPPLSMEQILGWADAYHARTGRWPTSTDEPIEEAPGETWVNINAVLNQGNRNLPGGCSLAQLLANERGVRYASNLPPLTLDQILRWADIHIERTTEWPRRGSGPILDVPGETWASIDATLKRGGRGLQGHSSLAQLLANERGVRNRSDLLPLTHDQILIWADSHYEHTGEWPKKTSGAIAETPGENWANIDAALYQGQRNLPGGSSLAQLLAKERGVRTQSALPLLSEEQILAWAVAHKERNGVWPQVRSGPIVDCPDETWRRIDNALVYGLRGLTGGSSLRRLLQEHQDELTTIIDLPNNS